MRFGFPNARRNSGFVLLYCLWLLLGGMVAYLVLMQQVSQRANFARGLGTGLRVSSSAESAAHKAMFELLARPGEWRQGNRSLSWNLNGVAINVVVRWSDGLVDLSSADPAIKLRFISTVAASFDVAAEQVLQAFPGIWAGYGQFEGLPLLTDSARACLVRDATLYSGRRYPDLRYASATVTEALAVAIHGPESQTTVTASDNPVGQVFRIDVDAQLNESLRRGLVVEMRPIGMSDHPVDILDWYWVPVNVLGGCRLGSGQRSARS